MVISSYTISVTIGNQFSSFTQYVEDPSLPIEPKPASADSKLTEALKPLMQQWRSIYLTLFSKHLWKKSDFVAKVDAYMINAEKVMGIYFEELQKEGNVEAMVAKMLDQNAFQENKTDFCYSYFDILFHIYHIARGCVYLDNLGHIHYPDLKEEEIAPYFTAGTPQERWRNVYNVFCSKVVDLGIKDELEKDPKIGQIYLNWAQQDLDQKAPFKANPDVLPPFPKTEEQWIKV